MTHYEFTRANPPARPCTAHDYAIGGGCFNCGYDPAQNIAPESLRVTTRQLPDAGGTIPGAPLAAPLCPRCSTKLERSDFARGSRKLDWWWCYHCVRDIPACELIQSQPSAQPAPEYDADNDALWWMDGRECDDCGSELADDGRCHTCERADLLIDTTKESQ